MPILAELQRRFGDAIVETHDHRGDLTAVVARDALLAVLRTVATTPRWPSTSSWT